MANEDAKKKAVPDAQCICGCTKRWIIWWNLLICDQCGEAFKMDNDELIHPAIFNATREARILED